MVYIYDYMFIPPIYGDLGVGFLLFYQHELISATRIFVKWPFWGEKIPDGRGKSLLLSIKARRGKMGLVRDLLVHQKSTAWDWLCDLIYGYGSIPIDTVY